MVCGCARAAAAGARRDIAPALDFLFGADENVFISSPYMPGGGNTRIK